MLRCGSTAATCADPYPTKNVLVRYDLGHLRRLLPTFYCSDLCVVTDASAV